MKQADMNQNTLKIDPQTDPFLKQAKRNLSSFSASPLTPTRAETLRRLSALANLSHPDDRELLEYFTNEETWAWPAEIIEEIYTIPEAGDRTAMVSIDMDAPGIGGVHIIEDTKKMQFMVPNYYSTLEEEILTQIFAIRVRHDGSMACFFMPLVNRKELLHSVPDWMGTPEPPFIWACNILTNNEERENEDSDTSRVHQSIITLFCKMQALLKKEALVHRTQRASNNKVRRQAKADKVPIITRMINVITWPKRVYASKSGDTMERDKHWWVKGHFKRQWYPAEGVHREIYINDYMQGNLDAPLYVPVRINRVKAA